jgi:DNA replication and repair protein RecF
MNIQKLLLKNYRNFEKFEAEFSPSISLIVGDNGVGKTNLLEAISCLAPGKGLRNALPEDICKNGQNNWHISGIANTQMSSAQLDIHYSKENHRKIIEFNGAKITNSELANFMNIIWLTPQMEGIFLGGPGDRRKFLDRMVFSSIPKHAQLVTKYEHQQKERMRILETSPHDSRWLDIVENTMSELGVEIIENRLKTIERINHNARNMDGVFPKATLELESDMVSILDLEKIRAQFSMNREKDRHSGRTNFGPQKSDMRTYYAASNLPAEQCSTGQQKALLISIIISQAIANEQNPILLLDEIFVHLDETRRKALGEFLVQNNAQAFITATDREIEQYLGGPMMLEL